MIKEFIRDQEKIIIHFGADGHCILGIISSYEPASDTIHFIPEGSQCGMEIPLPSILKMELLHDDHQHELLPKHVKLVTDVDFDNAILLQLPVSVWHRAYRIRNAGFIRGHDEKAVRFANQMYDKNSFYFLVERV